MNKRKYYDCIRAVVRDRTTTSHTSGSVTATGKGRNMSVSNTVRTNIKQEVLLEFPEGKIVKTVLINESIDAPVGQAIYIAFVKGEPIAYRLDRHERVHSLGYASQRSALTGQELLLLAPVSGTLFACSFAFMPDKYYDNGEMKEHHAGQVVAGVGLVATALSIWTMRSWVPYFIGTAITGAAMVITTVIHNLRENRGRNRLLEDVKREFDAMQANL